MKPIAAGETELVNLTPDTAELRPGFYWVKFSGEDWTVGKYSTQPIGSEDYYIEWEYVESCDYGPGCIPHEIGERIERFS